MIPAPDRKLVLQWMEISGGSDVIDIVHQVAVKAAAWGYLQQKPKPFCKSNNLTNLDSLTLEWYYNPRADSDFLTNE